MGEPKRCWTSPIASQEIVDGPDLLVQPGRVTLRYRGEGQGQWIELRFRDIIGVLFTEFSACTPEHLAAYDRLLDMGVETPLATEVLRAAKRDTEGMRHFRLFLDDIGAYDIVARDLEV